MTIDHGPQPAKTDKHPLQEGLEKPSVSPPEGERDSDRAQLIQTDTETLAGAPPAGGSGIDQGSQSDGGNEHRSNRGRNIILGTLASGLVTAIVIAGGNKLINSDKGGSAENPAPNPDRTVSAPATPGEATADTPTNPDGESLANGPTELSVEQFKDGESLANAWNTQANRWIMSNATKETKDNEDFSTSRKEYVARINEPIDNQYIDTLLVANWQNNPNLVRLVEETTRIHYNTVLINLSTTDSDRPEDLEPYEIGEKVISSKTISESNKEIITAIDYERWDNSDKNGANDFLENPINGVTGTDTLTWTNVDGVWKISDFS
jgi:hypothetical protein